MTNESRLMDILCAPIVSEKSNRLYEEDNVLVFRVLKDATKAEIKEASEKNLNVKVVDVHTINMQGKVRRGRFGMGKRSDWKKAYVKVTPESKVDLEALAKSAAEENKESK
ncbi:MAG: 50S ribosomal protein L23 [Succinivibrio sp.]|nr:50S ribosomal protein L23 [Succinivibrio sp.]